MKYECDANTHCVSGQNRKERERERENALRAGKGDRTELASATTK